MASRMWPKDSGTSVAAHAILSDFRSRTHSVRCKRPSELPPVLSLVSGLVSGIGPLDSSARRTSRMKVSRSDSANILGIIFDRKCRIHLEKTLGATSVENGRPEWPEWEVSNAFDPASAVPPGPLLTLRIFPLLSHPKDARGLSQARSAPPLRGQIYAVIRDCKFPVGDRAGGAFQPSNGTN